MEPTIPFILQWHESLYLNALTGLNDADDRPPPCKFTSKLDKVTFATDRPKPIAEETKTTASATMR
jgi:hypothetical protein